MLCIFPVPSIARAHMSPCFTFKSFLAEAAVQFNIKPENHLLTSITRWASPSSRKMLGTEVKRGQLNLLYYCSYVYRTEKGMKYCGSVQKFPKYKDKILKIMDDHKKMRKIHNINDGVYKNIISQKICPPYDPFNERQMAYWAAGLCLDPKYERDKLEEHHTKETVLLNKKVLDISWTKKLPDVLIKEKSFIKKNTILILEDGRRVYAKNHLSKKKIRAVNDSFAYYRIRMYKLRTAFNMLNNPVHSYKADLVYREYMMPRRTMLYAICNELRHRCCEFRYIREQLDLLEREEEMEKLQRIRKKELMRSVVESFSFKDQKGIFEEDADY
jgi:hypothetical protein